MDTLIYLGVHLTLAGLSLWLFVLWWCRTLDLTLGDFLWATTWAVLSGPLWFMVMVILWCAGLVSIALDSMEAFDYFRRHQTKVLFKQRKRGEK